MVVREERADAARNRTRVLEAAEELFARVDPASVTMEDIARAAGVGKGTLYRRYPNRDAVAVALLDEHERRLQERLLTGRPPLGPGAPPAARMRAFYAAMADLLDQHGHLALAAETGAKRFTTGAYGFWRAHVGALLDDAGLRRQRGALVDTLLAPLAPEVYQYQRRVLGISRARIVAALELVAEGVFARAPEAVKKA
ncbi:TetR/AcrR family transcriptional regulator [Paractinoplanes globisporus]|uniref:TetR/AcrR family transcriptional regulator n=1 Tax=Paractinoplanes globisporus TaxID=113565 RepID=A0ABW6WWV8_9ACTN|nr:TetR/AcrR family transcriptional regulator [Actinoplanes globisporus]